MTSPVWQRARHVGALDRYDVRGAWLPEAIQELTSLAADLTHAPFAMVSFLDDTTQWFVGGVGPFASEAAREQSFCRHAIEAREVLVVGDAAADARFASHALVTAEPHVRFYAGAPLLTEDGAALGTLCVFDVVARGLGASQERALVTLARQVVAQLELRGRSRALEDAEARLRLAEAASRRLTAIVESSGGALVGEDAAASATPPRLERRELLFGRRWIEESILAARPEIALDGILAVDGEGRVISYNERFGRMWRISAAILATRADAELLTAVRDNLRDPVRFMEPVVALRDHPDECSQDEVELKDGRVFDRYSAPVRDGDGHPGGRVWVFRDITERRRIEVALRRERDRAQQYLDSAEVMLLALDMEGRVTLINRKGCDIVGWTEAELLGRSWVELCLPERVRQALETKLHALRAGDVSTVRNPILTRDGRERLIEWRNRVLTDDEGRVVGTFSSGTDITEQHAAAEELRVAEERMRFALENADIGVWDMDFAANTLRWSSRHEAHYGLAPGQFDGTFDAYIERVHPEDRGLVLETLDTAMRTGADFSIQNRALWPDGQVRWLTGAGRMLLGEDGKPKRGLGISLDTTAKRLLEEQFHQAQKMEAIGRLAGGIAHDFNNISAVILLSCELLLEDLPPDSAARADVEQIKQAAAKAASLTRQLLTFSRKQVIEPTLVDLNTVMTGMKTMLARLIGEDVMISLDLRPSLWAVSADRAQLEQIVLNLVVNARDAMPHGGALTIKTDHVELDKEYARSHIGMKAGPHVVLTISDTGVGMSPAVKARLFEPFFTTKERGKGTGLGLATVHGIVQRSGGCVDVDSEVGKGTAFKVYLPRAFTGDLVGEATGPEVYGGDETVLVVDDSEQLGDIARRLLERLGYTVVVATGADDAIRRFDATPAIDLLLTDVVMPGLSGPELAIELVARRPTLKVIYMSGFNDEAIARQGVVDPSIDFVHKPFTADTLGRKVREVLDRPV